MVRFSSSMLYQIRTQKRIQEIVLNLHFLSRFRDVLPFQNEKIIVYDKKNLSFGGVCASCGLAFLLSLKLWGIIKIIIKIKI